LLELARAHAAQLPPRLRLRVDSAWATAAETAGDFVAANERARAVIALAENPADAGGAYSVLVANLMWTDPAAAEALLDRATEWTGPLGPDADDYIKTARAGLASARQDFDAAVSLLSQVRNKRLFGPLAMELAVDHLLRGDVQVATEMLEAMGHFGAITWFAYFEPYCRALIAAIRGDVAEARTELRRAVSLVRRWKVPLGLADCGIGCAAVALHGGDARRASELLATVRAATGGGLRSTMSMAIYRHYVRAVRGRLDPDAVTSARAAGAALTLEQAIARELGTAD
jgi:hypothetical protein